MTYPRLLSLAAFVAFTLSFGASHLRAQVLLDGSFEGTSIPANSSTAGAGSDWTSSGNTFLTSNNDANLGNTPYGSQYLTLDAGSSVSQTISGFVAGETYVLGADFADFAASAGTQGFTISITGAAVDSQTFTPANIGTFGSGTIGFQSGVLLFTATSSGSAVITLESLNSTEAVDNVALFGNAPTAPTTPEPSTYAEMLLGLGALGFCLKRRQTVRA